MTTPRPPLTTAILQTLAYSDIFDYPLTALEIHRYLPDLPANQETIREVIQNTLCPANQVSQTGEFFTLPGRERLAETRARRTAQAARLWPHALRYGRSIANFPYVRMVALTGTLAVQNVEHNADLDYFIITQPGRVWLCRAFVIGLVHLAARTGLTLCPNFFLSESALALPDQSLYLAREITQMLPLSGLDIYHRFRQANLWVHEFLPNADGPPPIPLPGLRPRAPLKPLLETVFATPLGTTLEHWEMTRKIRKFTAQAPPSAEIRFSPERCQGHFDGYGKRTMAAFEARLGPATPTRITPMSKLLFGQSYFLRFDPKLWAGMQPYPPLGTLYAASYLRAQGYEVALFDAMLAESEDEWAAALDREKPDFAILYEDNFNYLSKMCLTRMREAAFTMTGMAKTRGLPVIICGSDATDHDAQYLQNGADFVLLGEGEATLAELLARLTGKTETPFEEILGLAFREEARGRKGERAKGRKGEEENSPYPLIPLSPFPTTPRRPDLRDLDALPFPAWDLVDMEKYRRIWRARHGYFSMNMVTTRGCPFHCNWCAKPIWGQRYHSRSPENVAAEMKWLKDTYHPDHLWFADDILGLKPGWLPRFADAVERENARIPFKGLSRVDLLLREGEVDALRRAGADIVWVGAESGSQKILTAMEKGTKVEQIYEATRKMHAAGVKIAFFLQFGYPGETRADIEKTLQMVRELMPDDIGMSVSYPMPGTKFFDRVQGEMGEKKNWVDSADLDMMYQGPFTTEFYRHLHTTLHKEYRARKTWRVLQRLGRHPAEFRPAHIRQTVAMVYHTVTLPLAKQKLKRLEQIPHQGVVLKGEGLSMEEAAIPTGQEEQALPGA